MLLPRPLWWTLFGLVLLDFAWLTRAFFFDRAHWAADAVVLDVLCLSFTAYRLAYPPTSSDA